ncbi:terpenoid synthase [Tricholoma matsutake]|nr:terpenoid synthase [Tricholoma matsutake 945]
MAPSYQLPDLLLLSRSFELRTNHSCHRVSLASEDWLLGLKNTDLDSVLTKSEQSSLHAMKIGLLAALCFPSCDGTPLKLLTDFLNFLVLADERIRRVADMSDLGWRVTDRKSGLVPQIVRLSSRAPTAWDAQFTRSVNSYCDAQLQFMSNRHNGVTPDMEDYMKLRRSLSGFDMVLDLLELTENMTFPPMDTHLREKMTRLKQVALDIICYSLDVVSYNRDQAQDSRHNLISILMTHNGLSIQGALNLAGIYIKDLFDLFVVNERMLLGAQTPHHERDHASLGDITSYAQALRDCVAGTINWVYETELYFGKKGEEIRTFGWVFLDQISPPHSEEN